MLFRKMVREWKENRLQFLSIFFISFLGIFIFGGMTAIGDGMETSANRYYEETNLADGAIFKGKITDKEVELLLENSDIDQATRRLTLDCIYGNTQDVTMQLNVIDNREVSDMHLVSGRFDEGLWLDAQFAGQHQIQVGDHVDITFQNTAFTFTVAALVMQPDYIYAVENENQVIPNHRTFGYGFVSAEYLAKEQPEELVFNQLFVKTKLNKNELSAQMKRVAGEEQYQVVMRKDFPGIAMFSNEVLQMQSVSSVFPVVFLLIAVLTTLTTMTRITAGQRTQIGTLTALGITKKNIYLHYMNYGICIGTISSLLGALLGPMLLPPLLFQFQREFYSMPYWEPEVSPIIYGTAILAVVCYGIIGGITCRRELAGAPVAALLRPKAPKMKMHQKAGQVNVLEKLHVSVQWNVRDIMRNKIRSAIMILGSLGCVMLVTCAFGMKDTVKNLANVMYGELHRYETKVTLLQEDRRQVSDEKVPEGIQLIQESLLEIKRGNLAETVNGTIQGTGDLIHYETKRGDDKVLEGTGVSISRKLAEDWEIQEKDKIQLRIYGTDVWKTVEVTSIVNTPMGQGLFFTQKGWEETGYSFTPTAFLTNKPATEFAAKDFAGILSKKDMLESYYSMMDMMDAVISIMVGAAVVLGIVVFYNLGAMAFYEKYREMATLTVLGFTRKNLRKLLIQQNLWLTIVGIFLGIPCGAGLLTYMMQYMGDNLDLLPNINRSTYLLCSVGVLLLTYLVGILLARKLKSMDMVSALKSVE